MSRCMSGAVHISALDGPLASVWDSVLHYVGLVSLRLGEWPRIRGNRLVDDGRATCFDNVHRCLVDFHQRFPVGGHVQYPSPVYSATGWRHVHLVGPLSVLVCHSQLFEISEVI